MPQRASQRVSSRPASRHERRDGHDIADIYEARLLAQGLRSDDFVTLRSSTDIPHIPNIVPIRFGRGANRSTLQPIAMAADDPDPAETPDADGIDGTSAQESD